jgi:hypothetical protein
MLGAERARPTGRLGPVAAVRLSQAPERKAGKISDHQNEKRTAKYSEDVEAAHRGEEADIEAPLDRALPPRSVHPIGGGDDLA